MRQTASVACLLVLATVVNATLVIKLQPAKITGQKAIVKLEMKNTFTNTVESARAAMFVSNEKGKVIGQATRWIIGGTTNQPGLAPDQTTAFYFVIPLSEVSTNLQFRILPSRLILRGGFPSNPAKDFQIVR